MVWPLDFDIWVLQIANCKRVVPSGTGHNSYIISTPHRKVRSCCIQLNIFIFCGIIYERGGLVDKLKKEKKTEKNKI